MLKIFINIVEVLNQRKMKLLIYLQMKEFLNLKS
jgi:hypothetical protein